MHTGVCNQLETGQSFQDGSAITISQPLIPGSGSLIDGGEKAFEVDKYVEAKM